MRFVAGIFALFLAFSSLASEKRTAVTVDGVSYVQIQDVHVVSGGRIVLMYASGGTTVAADKLPPGFLASWGITDSSIAASKAASERQAEQSLAQSVKAGFFREVDGVVYDLRKPQAAWRQFSDAQIVQVIEDGAIVNPAPFQPGTTAVFVRNLPRIFADNEKANFMAKNVGDFSYVNRFGFGHTVRAYDAGRICARNEIPDIMIKGNLAFAATPNARPTHPDARPGHIVREEGGLRATGSGFFVSKDGYLLTNYHVVRDALRLEVKYKSKIYKAEVAEVDTVNDLALVKVQGNDFSALPVSHKESVDLGDAVFTIGFPNFEMQGFQPKYTDGKISSLAGMQDNASEYQISVPVQPGNSGGPLCDENGEVVGVIVARLNDMAAFRETGAVPQNVNYAVKAKFVLTLLAGVKELGPVLSRPEPARPAKPIQAVEDAIAMIRIY